MRLSRLLFVNPVAGLLGAALVAFALLAGGSATAHAQSSNSGGSSGKNLFHEHCSVCHGDDGAGSEIGKNLHAPDLRSSAVQKQSNAYLENFIRHGKGAMPPFGDQLSSKQIESLVHYVRTFGSAKKK